MRLVRQATTVLLAMLAIACSTSGDGAVATPAPTATRIATASPTPTATSTAAVTVTASPAAPPEAERADFQDTRVTRLVIPAIGIDAPVTGSHVVPDTSPAPPGCPPDPEGQETLTVPPRGIATPEETFEGLEHKAWIFGHSRWQGEPGLFSALVDIDVGDELFVDGVDRETGTPVTDRRFVVEALYLADTASGSELVTAAGPEEVPAEATVILQTSVRESGADRSWILDRTQVLARAENLVEGDLDDPCKYLLLFVIARAAGETS